MIPGVGCAASSCRARHWTQPLKHPTRRYLYSGLVRRKNALTVLFLTMLAMAIISFQWFFWVRFFPPLSVPVAEAES